MSGTRDRSSSVDDLPVMASGLAHELRHPLNAVRFTLASLLARVEKMTPPDLRDEALQIGREIREDMTRLEEIIDSFLRFARPEQQQPVRLDLRDILHATARFLRADLTNRGMTLRLEAPDGPVWVHAPEIHMRHVMMNLVLNAADASPPASEIVLRLGQVDGRARIEVEDRGPGILVEDAERIFEPFYSAKEGGTGLGLAICKRLVTDAGGNVSHRPASPQGAVFSVELPLAKEDDA